MDDIEEQRAQQTYGENIYADSDEKQRSNDSHNIIYKIVNHIIGHECNRCGEKLSDDLIAVWEHMKSEHSIERKPIKCIDCELYFESDAQLVTHYSEQHFDVEKRLNCDKCSQTFESFSDFWAHVNTAVHTQMYACDACDCQYATLSRVSMQAHQSLHTSDERVVELCDATNSQFDYSIDMIDKLLSGSKAKNSAIRCVVCGKKCSSAKYLAQHALVHNEKTLKCDYCGKCFAAKSKLTRHQNLSHFERRLVCEYCGYKTNDNYRLETHRRRVHIKERRFVCDVPQCLGKSFFKKSELLFHQSVMHSSVRPFVCHHSQCESKGFVSEQQLKRHQRVVHCEKLQYVCFWPECDAAYKYKKSLNLHINYHINGHSTKKSDELNDCGKDSSANSDQNNKSDFVAVFNSDKYKQIEEKPGFECDVCEKQFATQVLMRKHVRRVHSKMKSSATLNCQICGHSVDSKPSLDAHIRRVHKLAYSCYWPECHSSFNNKYLFNEHLLSHTGLIATSDKKCELNSEQTVLKNSGEKKFVCDWPQCNAAFKKKYSLTIHAKVHKKNQLFDCSECEFKGKSKVSLHLHRRRRHMKVK